MRKNKTGLSWQALIISAGLCLGLTACAKAPSDEEVKAMMQVTDVTSQWVSKLYHPWPPKLILVPTVSFRVKNLTGKPLTYVDFNAIFKFKGDTQNLGDNFLAAIRSTPVPPGELSPVITLRSNFGSEGRSLASFQNNPQWRRVEVKIFAQTHGSRLVPLGQWDVSRTIDFKEPETVGMGKPEVKKPEPQKETKK
jgi:hypothetical protein